MLEEFDRSVTRMLAIQDIRAVIHQEYGLLRYFIEKTTELYGQWEADFLKEAGTMLDEETEATPRLRAILIRHLNRKDEVTYVMHSSAFISAVALFEGLLQDICKILFNNNQLRPRDLAGNSNNRKAYLFLQKVIGLDLSLENIKWNALTIYSTLRNKIVHEQSRVGGKDVDQFRGTFLQSFEAKEVALDEIGTVAQFRIMKAGFIYTYCDTAEYYLQWLAEEIRQYIVSSGISNEMVPLN